MFTVPIQCRLFPSPVILNVSGTHAYTPSSPLKGLDTDSPREPTVQGAAVKISFQAVHLYPLAFQGCWSRGCLLRGRPALPKHSASAVQWSSSFSAALRNTGWPAPMACSHLISVLVLVERRKRGQQSVLLVALCVAEAHGFMLALLAPIKCTDKYLPSRWCHHLQ